MSVDLSQSPYFDDYDASKNYHRILFTPGRAVQAREFNQLQTLLQEQIQRFGNHIFQNGAMVIPGESSYNTSYEYVTVRGISFVDISEVLETNQVVITGKTSGVVAQIQQYQPNVGTDPITFYLQYLNGSSDGLTSRFIPSEELELKTSSGIVFSKPICVATGAGSVFNINAGIFYINGFFVESDKQSIILSRYTDDPSVVVGFRLIEETVDWTQDQTLLDNANGSANINAIGADRLKLTLSLECHDLDSTFDKTNFIQLASFKDGSIQTLVQTTDYSVLEDTLARRTYDESGDYTVENFGIAIREHLNTGSNGGLYSAAAGGTDDKFIVGVEQGKAYVRGFEVTNLTTQYIAVDKARDVGFINNSTTTMSLGAYIEATSANTTPAIGKSVKFYSGVPASAGAVPAGTILGYGQLCAAERDAAGVIRLYMIRLRRADDAADTTWLANAKSAYIAGSPAFTSLINPVLKDPSNIGLLYALPVGNVKTLLTNGASDTSLSVVRQITATADTNGNVILTAGSNEVFVNPSVTNSYASFGSTVREIASISTLGGTPTGSTLTIALGSSAASVAVTVTVQVSKQSSTYKTKTLTNSTITVAVSAYANNSIIFLSKADAVTLYSVIDANGLNITSKFNLVRNAQSDFYGGSFLQLKAGESMPTSNVTINFDYFIHGTSGDYFSADSYSVPYSSIPVETVNGIQQSLANFLDFRPRRMDSPVAGSDFNGTGYNSVEVPFPNSLLSADIQYYLPRVDKVYVDSKGNFGVIKGVPDNKPLAPKTPDNSMLLYTLSIPAYTSDIKKIASVSENNRRYTMRDIGKLETRISNLEYYTTLSLLETSTKSLQIVDTSTGLNRFKNGFVVDAFVDHSVGNYTSADYKCSVSPEDGTLRPEFSSEQVDMVYLTTAAPGRTVSNTLQKGSLVTVPYTEYTFIDQPYASDYLNVNPYAVYRWNGNTVLNPNSDTWYDSVYTNPEVTYQVYNNYELTQTWNSWQLYWTGTSDSTSYVYTYSLNGVVKSDAGVYAGQAHDTIGTLTSTTSSTSVQVVGDRVVDTSVVPYMRSREVAFKSTGLKPFTKMYPFFDNVNVTGWCKQDGQTYGADMITDGNGSISGVFTIPNVPALRFRTGSRQFTLIDNADNVKENSLAYGDATYTATGTLLTRTQSILATQKVVQSTIPYDPLAQSFFVEKDGGVFATSVDLFFASKDSSSSVTLEIRNMINGSPGQDVVPYSKVTLNPSQVTIVAGRADIATRFTFDSPVYLKDGTDYCFVVMSNSNNYNVYIGTMGNKVIGTNTYISKQPYIGVLFKSQNNVTWTEDQTSDMRFRLNVAKFQTNTSFVAAFAAKRTVPITLDNNPFTSVNASKVITIKIPNHNMFVGSKFILTGITATPGIDIAQFNAQQTVASVVDADSLTFLVSTAATSSGTFGGALVTTERNMAIDTVYPYFQELLLENTEVDWTLRGSTGKSINGTEIPYQSTAVFNITPNANTSFPFPMIVPSQSESTNGFTTDALVINAQLITYADNVSPVIDLNRIGIIGVVNRINSPSAPNETGVASGGNAIARYMTKILGLTNPATSLKMYLDVNRPQGSSVAIYFKTGNSEEEVNSRNWATLPTIVSVTATDSTTFNEATFGQDGLAAFGFYQFKIVMLSTSSANIPRCRRMRGIALGT